MKRCTLVLGVALGLGACHQSASPEPPPRSGRYYVDAVNGNDAAAGDSAHPFRTPQHAADLVNPGDVVVVRSGVYTAGGSVLDIERGGTAGHYVVFRAAVPWGAILDGGQTSHTAPNGAENGVYLGASFVRVEGFEIRNVWHDGISPASGVGDFQIVGNHIHDIGRYCETGDIGLSGMTFINDNIVIERNLLHDIGRDSTGENSCNPGNTNWQNHDHGLYLDSGTNIIVRNNVFYNITRGWAIQCYGGTLDRLSIANNTFALPNPNRDGQIILATTITNLSIENNIFYLPGQNVGISGTQSGSLIDHNLSTGTVGGGGTGSNIENTDPLLVNPTGLAFQLLVGSPAIEAGVTLSYVTNDFLGVSRPQGAAYDIGAFEFP